MGSGSSVALSARNVLSSLSLILIRPRSLPCLLVNPCRRARASSAKSARSIAALERVLEGQVVYGSRRGRAKSEVDGVAVLGQGVAEGADGGDQPTRAAQRGRLIRTRVVLERGMLGDQREDRDMQGLL